MPLSTDDIAVVIADAIKAATAPLLARLAVLETKDWPTGIVGQKGEPGAPGRDGKDAEVDLEALAVKVVALMPVPRDGVDGKDGVPGRDGLDGKDGNDGAPGVDGTAGRDGLDGKDGAPGRDGLDGKDGAPGRDGLDGKDGAPGRDGLDGKDGALGPAGEKGADGAAGRDGQPGVPGVAGRDGEDGKDGAPGPEGQKGLDGKDGRDGTLENLKAVFDGERTVTLSFKDGTPIEGGVIKFAGVAIYRGVYASDRAYETGDQVTYGGSQWIAKSDSQGRQPGTNDGAPFWQLCVKKGNDGKPGPQGPKGDKGLDGKHGIDLRRS